LLESFQRSELRISKSLRLVELLVFNNSDVCDFAASEEVVDVSDSSIKGEISEMDSIRWLIWEWKFFTDRVTCEDLVLVVKA
jgi:hypothetical protein